MCKPLPTGKYTIRELASTPTERIRQCQEIAAKHDPNGGTGYFLEVSFSIPEELHDYLDFAPVASGLINPEWLSPLSSPDKTKNKKLFPYLGRHEKGVVSRRASEVLVTDGYCPRGGALHC